MQIATCWSGRRKAAALSQFLIAFPDPEAVFSGPLHATPVTANPGGQMKRIAVLTAVAAAIVTGIVQGQGKTDATLNELAADWAAAYNAKDAAKLASFYTEDAVFMAPNQPMIKGRGNIQTNFEREFQQGATNMQLKPMESATSGSQAFEAGTVTFTTSDGRSGNSKYVAVFKQVGGAWKIAYDIHNSDQPPAKQ